MAAVVGGAGVVGSLFNSRNQRKDAKRSAQQALFQPFQATSPFGSASISPTGMNVDAGLGFANAEGFDALTQQFLAQIQPGAAQAFTGISGNDAFRQAHQLGGMSSPFIQAGGGFLGAGQDFLQQLQGFDRGAFEQTQFDRLNSLASSGEETATNQALNRLFAGGRLGDDTATSEVTRGLQEAQANARTGRALSAIDLGRAEQSSLLQNALGLSQGGVGIAQGGSQLAGNEIQNFLQAIQGGQGAATGQLNFQGLLAQLAQGTTAGTTAALAPTQQNISNLLTGSNIVQSGRLGAAGIQSSGQQAASAGIGDLFSGLATGGFSAALAPE